MLPLGKNMVLVTCLLKLIFNRFLGTVKDTLPCQCVILHERMFPNLAKYLCVLRGLGVLWCNVGALEALIQSHQKVQKRNKIFLHNVK